MAGGAAAHINFPHNLPMSVAPCIMTAEQQRGMAGQCGVLELGYARPDVGPT
jgi:hypothetical protein